MKRLFVLSVLTALSACGFNPDAEMPVAAARTLTRQYAKQKLDADAAGTDCLILLVRTKKVVDHATIEAIHYGTGDYIAYDGGVQQYAEDRKFRAVVYRDSAGGLWTYGATTRDEAKSMPVCR